MATYGLTYQPPRTSPYTLANYRTPTAGTPGGNLASAFAGGPQNQDLASGSYYNQTALPKPVQAPATATRWLGGSQQFASTPAAAAAPTAPNVYDITTDPALQAITALTGRSDEDAQAQALKQRQGQLLGYGDQNLAQSVLGDATIAQAAGANPTSTLAQLGQHRTQNIHDLTEGLNKQNLFYGGYRVTQEQQAAQDYQNALAQAAAGVNTNLDTISANLAQTLAANQAERIAALQAAYQNQPPGTAGTATGVASPAGAPQQQTLDPSFVNNFAISDATQPAIDPYQMALIRALGLGTTTNV